MRLNYLPQPGMSSGAGVGSALGALGKTMSDLGQLSLDEKERKNKAEMENLKLSLLQKADTRADGELKLNQDKFKSEETKAQYKALQEALDRKDLTGAVRIAHPKATQNMSDGQVYQFGQMVDKLLPKNREVRGVNLSTLDDGEGVVSWVEYGGDGTPVLRKESIGKVKTDWNSKTDKASTKRKPNEVNVDADFASSHWHSKLIKQDADGTFYTLKDDFNKLNSGQAYTEKRSKDIEALRLRNVEEEENGN